MGSQSALKCFTSMTPALPAKVPSYLNYLALFIVARVYWRQAAGIPKRKLFFSPSLSRPNTIKQDRKDGQSQIPLVLFTSRFCYAFIFLNLHVKLNPTLLSFGIQSFLCILSLVVPRSELHEFCLNKQT